MGTAIRSRRTKSLPGQTLWVLKDLEVEGIFRAGASVGGHPRRSGPLARPGGFLTRSSTTRTSRKGDVFFEGSGTNRDACGLYPSPYSGKLRQRLPAGGAADPGDRGRRGPCTVHARVPAALKRRARDRAAAAGMGADPGRDDRDAGSGPGTRAGNWTTPAWRWW